ncbi:ATP dependent helicase, Lhr family [Candidatus Sulfotelmatobacter kueseliae]|uniref:ATP dependent helicase, Lhr family n=1 Tax=Candidatus Sulfotelmatobacter kueseliae TaxID=2042962 RepID=A0A2U3K1F2_9BACT|nr:ATP dependent helicase, Lhr family [Candidatus Sulfotelmatobacter kueseliae]
MSPFPASLAWAHPLLRDWFVQRFGTPTEPQEQGWPHILAGRTTLISAPTGSGKTLAAFLACIDRLVRKALAGDLQDRTEVLYISPLKALGNDIQKNLEIPLGEILQMAGQRGLLMPQIRTAVRTGDTLMHERRAMLKHPPHILVTTPESLYILLTAEKSRAILRDVETVIVDEIHAVADDKRGAHLTLSLERLESLCHSSPLIRIGLSATQKPIEEIAHFLTGNGRPEPVIVNVGHQRQLDLAVEVPATQLGPIATNEMWDEIYDRIVELVGQNRSTLVFVNTRRLAERVSHQLAERLGEDNVAAHHGSLSRKLRLTAENKLKEGQVKVLVATASLELGIDIGTVDLVIQISSPRAIAVGLQRVGRSGHWRGAIPKGRFFATTRDELQECAALVRAIRDGDLDRLMIPEAPADILAQQIVAICAAGATRTAVATGSGEEDAGWDEDDLFALVRRAYPYRNLTRETYDSILEMLSEGIAARRGRYGAYLHRDRVNRKLRARRGSRLAAITSGGAIPETALFTVVAQPEGMVVGTVDEDFAVESNAGDIMLLGNSSWRIHRVEVKSGRMLVEDAHGAPPTIPFWRGEAPARTQELSFHVASLRKEISDRLHNIFPVGVSQAQPEVAETVVWLKEECGLDDSGAEQAIEYILQGRAVLGDVPTQATIIAERFFDEGGGMQLVIHAPFGGRINKAWGLALRKRFCRSFNFELQAAATDNGLNIALAEQHSFPLADVFHFLNAETVQPILEQAALASPFFATRWRWDAGRALALLRFQSGKKVPPQIQRMRSDDLMASVFPDVAACQENIEGDIQIPDHPLIKEVMKDVLTEAMDLDGLKKLLRDMDEGRIRCVAVDTPVPSQFSHEILNANPYAYLDDAPLEERRARAVEMRRVLPESVLEEVGKLDPAAIAQVREEAWPDVRDADELHDVLHTLIAMPTDRADRDVWPGVGLAAAEWFGHFQRLVRAGRATSAVANGRHFWVAAERAKTFSLLFPGAIFDPSPAELEVSLPSRDDALLALVTGWMSHLGPATAAQLGELLGLPSSEIDTALLRMEASGAILRGNFTGGHSEHTEWCERRLLARIHRLTVATLRKQIEPVTAAHFMQWLLRWQHVAPGTQVQGERATLEIVRQLQGFEIPANAWERQILARRIADYDPKWLDQLCLTGAVGWGRLSPHPATLEDSAAGKRRVIPTSVAPITFFIREEADWMMPQHSASQQPEARGLSEGARQVLDFLRQRGASFFADIVRGTDKLKAEVETALWELVAAGVVTADGFDNLRSLIDPKRRAGQGSGRSARPRHSSGRWALLYTDQAVERTRAVGATCWMLLKRYGIVFRDLLARETNLPKWRELQVAFRRIEDRGEIRGGRFVDGFIGEQFALPVAVESLRAARKLPPTQETITLSAADPLNLVGILVPGERVPAISGKIVSFRDGVAVQEAEHPTMPQSLAMD